jgi:hypothetical protein
MSFSVDVSDWIDKATQAPETVIRGTAIKLFKSIIISSPVDEGTFRANWFVSGATPSNQVNENVGGGYSSDVISRTSRDVEALVNWEAITFTNNLPYARRLEFGYSNQAPQGMVRVNAMRFNELIREEVSKL